MKKLKKLMLNHIGSSDLIGGSARRIVSGMCGIKLAKSTQLWPHSYFADINVEIGNDSFINSECYFDRIAPIKIGDNCGIGMRTVFCTGTHEIGESHRRAGKTSYLPITVEDGCWIGANVTIFPDVTIGAGCVIAAGAVVTKNTEPNCLYGGVPAKKIRELK